MVRVSGRWKHQAIRLGKFWVTPHLASWHKIPGARSTEGVTTWQGWRQGGRKVRWNKNPWLKAENFTCLPSRNHYQSKLKNMGEQRGLEFSLTTIPKDQIRPSLKTDDHDQPSKSSTIIKSMIHPTSWKKRPRPSECPDLPQKECKVLLSFEKASQKGMMWYDGK